jgi:CBS domain containing-hemolysin-like protein
VDRAVSTVGGLILARLGRVPLAGDEVRVRNLKLRVEAMSGRVIEKVSVSLVQRPEPAGGGPVAGPKEDAA